MALPDRGQPEPAGPDPDHALRVATKQLEVLDQLDTKIEDLTVDMQHLTTELGHIEHLVMTIRATILGDGGERP